MDISLLDSLMLIVLGLVAGVINTLAGGGSNLTVPALMVMGMPPDVANATNRVGVILQGRPAFANTINYQPVILKPLSCRCCWVRWPVVLWHRMPRKRC